MATLIEDLQVILAPLASGGAHYAINESEPAATPYIVFQVVASGINAGLQGRSGMQSTRVQIDVYSPRIDEVQSRWSAIDAAMEASESENVMLSWLDTYDTATGCYRRITDYLIWHLI